MLVIISGGLGSDQTTDIQAAVKGSGFNMFSAGSWDGWKNVKGMLDAIRASGGQPLGAIGHSWGGEAVSLLPCLSYLALVDPVSRSNSDLIAPAGIRTDWFRRTPNFDFSFTWRAWVNGVDPIIVKGGHNKLPHMPEVIDRIIEGLKETVTKYGTRQNSQEGV